MSFLEIGSLRKQYGPMNVVSDITLSLEKGGFLVLVGPSGCGKSTLLNMIAGLETISGGTIHLDGTEISQLPPAKRDIAMVFQSYALYPNMSVAGNISFGLEMRGVPKAKREAQIAEVAKKLQIEHLLKRRPSQLSGGQRQRVAMGRALVRDPRLFLFDEPLSNLDAKLRVDMRAEIKRLHASTGTTVIYVTHDQIEAMTLATKIAVLKDGVLQQVGTPHEVYNRPANLFVANFMGSPSMNLIESSVESRDGSLLLRSSKPSPSGLCVKMPQSLQAQRDRVGESWIMGLRPEAITDRLAGHGVSNPMMVDGRVELVEPAGSDTYLVVKMGDDTVTARVHADMRVKVGETIPLMLDLDKMVLFEAKSGLAISH